MRVSVELPGLEEIRFTPTQRRIVDLLSDGEPHDKAEMRLCLYDDLGGDNNVHYHICQIRKLLLPVGYLIMIQFRGRTPLYRLVQSIEVGT